MIDRTYGSAIDAYGERYPSELALVCGDMRLNYREFFGRVRATGRALRATGLEPGDRIAILLADSAELLEVLHGALWAGLTVVPLNVRLALDDHRYMVRDAGARALVFDAEHAERAHAILEDVDVAVAIATVDEAVPIGGQLLPRLVTGRARAAGAPAVSPDAPCWIQYTGGTTGLPKGAVHSHRTSLSSFYSCVSELDVRPGEITAHVAPLTHSGAAYLMPVWARGGAHVLLGGFDPERLLDTIEREHVTSTLVVPTMLYALLDHAGIGDRELSSLRTITYGAAPIGPERLQQALAVFGPILQQLYGQTEAPAQITMLTKQDHLRALNDPGLLRSCGRPVAIADVACVDDHLQRVADGTPGEIVVRGPNVMLGYLDKPDETAAALRGGWLCTGDIGVRDERGYFSIVDRKKDMIISGGFNVYPKEIEQVLFAHPSVADACVVGIPDPKWGEAVKAVIVARDGAQTSPAELIDFVKERKGSVLAPKSVEFVDAIPLTSVGKHDKKAVRSAYWQGTERAVN
ncbi:MAG: AMP-binding protein [Nocardioides sp.]|uniref:AMP-binding protein n=1 Tax=Nocardioides sp. TaxID=35761 RepID=UPI0039E71F02